MDFERIVKAIAGLKLMPYFPGDEDTCIELAKGLEEMADTEEQIEWAIRRVRKLYTHWPGEHELRAVYCSKFKSKDGVNAYSAIYGDGIPPEERPLIGPPASVALPLGAVSADAECDAAVRILADRTRRVNISRPAEEISPIPKLTDRITELVIDKTPPTFQQYAWGVANDERGAHDQGGAIIHATLRH